MHALLVGILCVGKSVRSRAEGISDGMEQMSVGMSVGVVGGGRVREGESKTGWRSRNSSAEGGRGLCEEQ